VIKSIVVVVMRSLLMLILIIVTNISIHDFMTILNF